MASFAGWVDVPVIDVDMEEEPVSLECIDLTASQGSDEMAALAAELQGTHGDLEALNMADEAREVSQPAAEIAHSEAETIPASEDELREPAAAYQRGRNRMTLRPHRETRWGRCVGCWRAMRPFVALDGTPLLLCSNKDRSGFHSRQRVTDRQVLERNFPQRFGRMVRISF